MILQSDHHVRSLQDQTLMEITHFTLHGLPIIGCIMEPINLKINSWLLMVLYQIYMSHKCKTLCSPQHQHLSMCYTSTKSPLSLKLLNKEVAFLGYGDLF